MKNYLQEQEGFIVGTYTAPCPPIGDFPAQNTLENYQALKDAGVNLVMGLNDMFGEFTEEFGLRAIELCKQVGLKYLAFDDMNGYFTALQLRAKDKKKDFRKYTEEEKKDLLDRYAKSVARYLENDTCVGVKFSDEFGWENLEGIKYAKDFIEKKYPNKLFYCNFLGYNVSDAEYKYGAVGASFRGQITLPEMPTGCPTDKKVKIGRYETYVDKVMNTLNLSCITYDQYPLHPIGGCNNTINDCIYHLCSFLARKKKELGVPVGAYIQDGHWDKNEKGILTRAEFDLQFNIMIAYGLDMLLLYIGCFTYDIRNLTGDCGLIGKDGTPSLACDYLRLLNRQLVAVGKDIRRSVFQGMMAFGEFKSLQPKDLSDIPDNDAIFDGKMPEDTLITQFEGIKRTDATSQCIMGCFENETENVCYLVNNSIFFAANVFIEFDKVQEFTFIRSGVVETVTSDKLSLYGLEAGEGVLIKYRRNNDA